MKSISFSAFMSVSSSYQIHSFFFLLFLRIELTWRDDVAAVAEDYNKQCIWAHSSKRHEAFLDKNGGDKIGCFGTYCLGENLATSTHLDNKQAIQIAM